jgi:hypothetical protein
MGRYKIPCNIHGETEENQSGYTFSRLRNRSINHKITKSVDTYVQSIHFITTLSSKETGKVTCEVLSSAVAFVCFLRWGVGGSCVYIRRNIVLMHPSIHETEIYSGEQAHRMA